MTGIRDWIKTFLILYFFLTMILYLIPKATYQKYIKFVVKMILLVVLFLPLLNKLNQENGFMDLVEEFSDYSELEQKYTDTERLEDLQNEYIEERSNYYEEHFGKQE